MASINEIIQSAIDRVKLKGSDTWIKWSFWTRAKDVELDSGDNVENVISEINEDIANEITRATNRENEIETALNSEITRAKSAESTLSTSINNEITRAKNAENTLETNKVPITRTINGKALSSDITLSASDVGADASGSANTALTNAKAYTDTKVADLVGTAPETLDTLEELADALKDNADIVDVLNESITSKASAVDLTSHTGNTTIHITSTERTNWNDANSKKHTHSNKTVLDNTTASYTTADKTKLDGIATSAEVNQNAFSNVVIGSTTITADSKTDSLTLVGSNVTLTPDVTNDKVTIGITKANVTSALGYTPPTTNTVYTHPTTSGNKHIPSGGSSGQILRWSADGTAVWGADNNTTYSVVSTTADGLAPKRDGSTTKYLRADGTWAVPPDTNTTYTSLKNPYSLTIQGNGTTLTNGTYDGSAAKTVNITPSSIGAAASSHTHSIANVTNLQTTLDGKAVKKELISENLNDIKTPGFYNAGGGNSVTNEPSGVDHFGLYVVKRASGDYYTQILIDSNKKQYRRHCENGTWGSWVEDKLTDTNTTYSAATTSASGLMTAAMVTKLNGIATGANAYSHPTSSGNKHIPSGGSSGQILRWSADGTAVWGNDNNTTYSNFVKSGSGAKAGLVPAPSTTAGTTKYLREDGTWAVPPDTNTTYTSLKNPYALTIQGNGTTLTNGTYDGSAAKTVNITPSSIGAAASSHSHSYLPLSGGTLTGNVTFAEVTSTTYPAKSCGIYWSGSTDGASIYYRVDGSDAGRLVLNLTDDANTYITFAKSGTDFATIDTSGNYSGNAATATKLKTARTISLTGSVTGSGSFDGSGNLSIATTTNHTHNYLPLAGGSMTGNILPAKANSYSIGSYPYPFAYIYTNYMHFMSSGAGRGDIYYASSTDTMYQSASTTTSDTIGMNISSGTNMRLYAGGRLFLNGNTSVSANTWNYSDEKIKSFTDDIDDDKNNLIKLFDIITLKSYRYKYSEYNALTLGFSAQDIESACVEIGIDPEKYNILNIEYGYMMSRGADIEDSKYYTKFYSVSYNDLYNLSLLKIKSMEDEHLRRLNSLEERLSALENKEV